MVNDHTTLLAYSFKSRVSMCRHLYLKLTILLGLQIVHYTSTIKGNISKVKSIPGQNVTGYNYYSSCDKMMCYGYTGRRQTV